MVATIPIDLRICCGKHQLAPTIENIKIDGFNKSGAEGCEKIILTITVGCEGIRQFKHRTVFHTNWLRWSTLIYYEINGNDSITTGNFLSWFVLKGITRIIDTTDFYQGIPR